MTKQDRSDAYLMKRLEREFPAIHADWIAGKYASKRQALIAARLRQPDQPLNALKRAWKKADPSEQAEFRKWIGVPTPGRNPARPAGGRSVSSIVVSGIVDREGRLLPAAADRIRTIMRGRSLKVGLAMKEMGYTNVYDASLGSALSEAKPCVVNADLQKAIEKWLDANAWVT